MFLSVLTYTMEADGLHVLHRTSQILIFITSPPASPTTTTLPPLMFTGNESAVS